MKCPVCNWEVSRLVALQDENDPEGICSDCMVGEILARGGVLRVVREAEDGAWGDPQPAR